MTTEKPRTPAEQAGFERGRLDALIAVVGRTIISSVEQNGRFPQSLRQTATIELRAAAGEPKQSDTEWVRGYRATHERLAKQLMDCADLWEEMNEQAGRS